jgi:hypothetical protein
LSDTTPGSASAVDQTPHDFEDLRDPLDLVPNQKAVGASGEIALGVGELGSIRWEFQIKVLSLRAKLLRDGDGKGRFPGLPRSDQPNHRKGRQELP